MNPGLVVKLRPSGPWRIGPDSGARNRVDVIYHSDSLFSAVTSAMSRMGSLAAWLDATARSQTPAVCFSSCFPFLDDIGFVVPPRTVWPPTSPAAMSARVRWKSARFIPLSMVESILAGKRLNDNQWSVDGASGCLVPAGKPGPFRTSVRWNAAVDRLSGTSERHATACIEFREGCGLWTVVRFRDDAARDQWQEPVKAAFRWLADSGFGGERSRGWGRSETPEFVEGTLPGLIIEYKRRAPSSPVEEPPTEEPPITEPPPSEDPDPQPEPPVEEPPNEELSISALPPSEAPDPPPNEEPSISALPPTEVPGPLPNEESSISALRSTEALEPLPNEEPSISALPSAEASEPPPNEESSISALPSTETPDPPLEPQAAIRAATVRERSDTPQTETTSEARETASETDAPTTASVRAPDLTEPMQVASEPAPPLPPASTVPLQAHWLLSLFTPAADDTVDWGRGSYTVLARGGRIDSPSGSGELKKQIQMVAEGSVLYADGVPSGAAADVAPDGFAHPVFRAGFALAIPLPEVH
jgi:CRISPR type III-A-associated RAMP protein Csm4